MTVRGLEKMFCGLTIEMPDHVEHILRENQNGEVM